ncbi:MAG: TetR/AcrR family transcriptional regulator [Bdellovibrionales bacterium]|nr:TetR/AcrR family transcriptional regulator [Bdellovibrionales bacterium]
MNNTKPVARRRRKSSHTAVIRAASELLIERGYCSVTVDQITERAGVSKQTIYRWWTSKLEIYVELYHGIASQNIRVINEGNLRDDLFLYGKGLLKQLSHPVSGLAFRGMVAEAQESAEGHRIFMAYMTERFEITRGIIANAISRGEISPNTDKDILSSAIGGAVVWRVLLGDQPLTKKFIFNLCDLVYLGLRKPSEARLKKPQTLVKLRQSQLKQDK